MIRRMVLWLALLYVLPVALAAGLWLVQERPMSWRTANWSSAGILQPTHAEAPAEVRVYTARTGRYKGIVSVHSWLVIKRPGAVRYDRYEVVGWGTPVRHNSYAPDARWYSNEPELLGMVRGARAQALIPRIDQAIATYPHDRRGTYRVWPGPNSNSFTAYVLNAVPELGLRLPPTAIGKDFPVDGALIARTGDGSGLRLSLNGIVSLTLGLRDGVELSLFGLVAGIDLLRPAIKLPGLGRLGISPRAA